MVCQNDSSAMRYAGNLEPKWVLAGGYQPKLSHDPSNPMIRWASGPDEAAKFLKYEKGVNSRTAYQPVEKVPVVKRGEQMQNFQFGFWASVLPLHKWATAIASEVGCQFRFIGADPIRGIANVLSLSFANRNGWPRLLPEYVWGFVLVHSVKWKFATIRALGNHSRCIVDVFRLAMAFCGTGCPSRRSCCMSRHLRERISAS